MFTRVRYGINELSANNNYLADFSWPSPKHACIQRTHMWQMIASRFCCSLKIHAKQLRVQSNRCFLHLGIFRVYLTHPPTHFRQSDDYTAVVTPNFIYGYGWRSSVYFSSQPSADYYLPPATAPPTNLHASRSVQCDRVYGDRSEQYTI